MGECKGKLQGLLDNFLARFDDLQKQVFLVNSFMVDVVSDVCAILKCLVLESSAAEME